MVFQKEQLKYYKFISFKHNIKMTQFNMLNVKLSNSQLINKLKSAIKNVTGVTLNLSSNIISNSNDENNFPHKLLANTQVSILRKVSSNGSSANIGFLKIFFNIGQLGGCLGRLLEPLLKIDDV